MIFVKIIVLTFTDLLPRDTALRRHSAARYFFECIDIEGCPPEATFFRGLREYSITRQ